MRKDEINDPLGVQQEPRSDGGSLRFAGLASIVICVFGGMAAAGAYLERYPGQPATVSAEIVRVSQAKLPPTSKSVALASGITPPAIAPGAEDIEDGVRIIRGGDPTNAPIGAVIHVPQSSSFAAGDGLPPAPDPRLVENGRFGPLPKIGANGDRPFEVYRRHATIDDSRPKIALVVTGMGLNEDVTRAAVAELPADVTFAFAPIGANLWDQVAEARQAGHEVLLQVPMEPLATDGGGVWPHELTAAASAARNIENLRWSMSRFPGYFGIMNFLGSKLMADRSAVTPIFAEIAGRGLGFIDDGTAPESLAPAIAATLQMPTARADISLDAGGAEGMDASLATLESLSRSHGAALGVAAGLPATIDRLKQFTGELAESGFDLVPASTLASPTDLAASEK